MPAIIALITADTALAESWERQLPAGRTVLRLGSFALPGFASSGFAAVVILDAAAERQLPPILERCPTIFVGEPSSHPFEQARLAGRARVYLSYDESRSRLNEFMPLVEEVAEKHSMLNLLMDKVVRIDASRQASRSSAPFPQADPACDLWDFLEGAVENLENRERLIAEFRRAARQMLHTSHATFFFRSGDAFRADRGALAFPADDAVVAFFERHPIVVDGSIWEGAADPNEELAVRNRILQWSARLIIPVHENGRLLGLVVAGVRDDGQPYDEQDRARAVGFARLIRQFISKSAEMARLSALSSQNALGARYLPHSLLLGPGEDAPGHVPVVVRDLVGRVRHLREGCRIAPSEGQPFRASAGLIEETGGVWVSWEEASAEMHRATERHMADRRELLRELGLTLSHEFGNSLVSLALLKQLPAQGAIAAPLLDTLRSEITRLEKLSDNIGLMQTLHEAVADSVDIRDVARAVGQACAIKVETGPDPVIMQVAKGLVEFALRMLVETVCENRHGGTAHGLKVQVRSTGSGPDQTALISLEGAGLELEGILPEPVENTVPNLGRVGVLLAKEILRMHRGDIHAGPGMDGTEILVSLRSL
jgi:hypothetical protein